MATNETRTRTQDQRHYVEMFTGPDAPDGNCALVARALYAADEASATHCEMDTDYQSALQDRYPSDLIPAAAVLRLIGCSDLRRRLTRVD